MPKQTAKHPCRQTITPWRVSLQTIVLKFAQVHYQRMKAHIGPVNGTKRRGITIITRAMTRIRECDEKRRDR